MAQGPNVIELTEANWQAEVVESKVPVLVDFGATWCGPCRMLSPIIDKLADEVVGKAKVGKVDIDQSPGLASRFNVRGVPTVVVLVGGERKAQHVGLAKREDLLRLLGV